MIFNPYLLQKYRLVFLKLRAISGSSRFYMLNVVRNNEPISVTELVEITKMEQAAVSQLLSILRKAEFVESKSRGKERLYEINKKQIKNIINFCAQFSGEKSKQNALITDAYAIIFSSYKNLKDLLNPGRLIIIEFLSKKDSLSVSEIIELTKQPQSMVSQNLRVLKDLKVLSQEVSGRNVFYRLNLEELKNQEEAINKFF